MLHFYQCRDGLTPSARVTPIRPCDPDSNVVARRLALRFIGGLSSEFCMSPRVRFFIDRGCYFRQRSAGITICCIGWRLARFSGRPLRSAQQFGLAGSC